MRTGAPWRSSGISDSLPPGVRWLLFVNIGVFLLTFLLRLAGPDYIGYFFGLTADQLLSGWIWQPVTYLFIHGDFLHLLFNMLALWMFGRTLEGTWGTRRFLNYYFICGVSAGLCVVLANILLGESARTIGASGSIFGLLLAFGVLFPRATVIFFIFPIEARWLVIIYAAIAFFGMMGPQQGVSHVAHLGGMLFGYLYLKSGLMQRRSTAGGYGYPGYQPYRPSLKIRLQEKYREWKMQRARRKFEVYLRKRQERDRDRTLH